MGEKDKMALTVKCILHRCDNKQQFSAEKDCTEAPQHDNTSDAAGVAAFSHHVVVMKMLPTTADLQTFQKTIR